MSYMSQYDVNLRILFNFIEPSSKSFVKAAINCIVAECLDQLYILRDLIGQCDLVFSENIIEYRSLEERFMGVEDHGEYRINLPSSNYDKVALDINSIINVLKGTLQEIDAHGTFRLIEGYTNGMKRMEKDDKDLMKNVEKNEAYIEELIKQCEGERLHNIKTIEETHNEIQKLRFDVEEAELYVKQETNYFNKWERARREQNDLSCEGSEKIHKDVIKEMTDKIKLESRVHGELMKYIAESSKDYVDDIQYWMQKLDDETDKREAQVMNMKMNLEKLNFDLSTVKDTYKSRTAAIADWLVYKKKKAEKEAQAKRERVAAIKIQAWWRGMMFRHKLGPYRKKKKKGKDDKKKKK